MRLIERWELVATAIRTRARVRGVRLHDDVIEDFAKAVVEAVPSTDTPGAVGRVAVLEEALEIAASDSGRFTAEGYIEHAKRKLAAGGQ